MAESNPSTSDSELNSVVQRLNNGLDFRHFFFSTEEVVNKISEFSNFLNSTGRIALMNANPQECQELVCLLLNLKKSMKSVVSELGKSNTKRVQHFECTECDETIEMPPGANVWETLQNHEHFENLFSNFLSGNLNLTLVQNGSSDELESLANNSNAPNCNNNEHTDSGIEQNEEQSNGNGSASTEEEEQLGNNSFRFNFNVNYDPSIQSVIYPESFVSMNKFDQCPYITIQKISPCQAVCLLCSCDLISTKRITKKQCLDHVLGQRHMKAAVDPSYVESLQKYHEVFQNLDVCYQAHQVYFEPDSGSSVDCKLCDMHIKNKVLIDHIQGDIHKGKIMSMVNKKDFAFYLMDLQVTCYGVELPKTTEASTSKPEQQEKRSHGKKHKGRLNSAGSKEEPEVQHNIIHSFTDSGNKIFLDLLPHRFYSHSQYFVDHINHFRCSLCRVNINKDTKSLKKHILSSSHLKLAEEKLPKYAYFCEICNMRFSGETLWDKHFTGEQNRHSTLSKTRLDKVIEYECTVCKAIIYGDEVSLTRHISKGMKRGKERTLPVEVEKMFKSREIVEQTAETLAKEANNTVTCMQRTLECCARLETILRSSLEECKAHPFGSRVSGLGNQESDLDLFIDTGDMYWGRNKQDSVSQCKMVKQVAGILRKCKGEFEHVHDVPTARTPIVKLKHIGTQLECDLSFRHGLSVENTKFLKLCLDMQQPICQQFILVLKKWAEYNKLPEHITNYALAILAIFYLQVNGYLLSVKKLRELNPTPAPVINGWETIKYTMDIQLMKNHVLPYEHSLVRLLKDFFAYYSSFNYAEDTVCPLLGHIIKRGAFQDPKSLPPEMDTYVKQLRGPEGEEFRFMSVFCIQDPFDLSHNLTKACQGHTLNHFKNICNLSYQQLELLK